MKLEHYCQVFDLLLKKILIVIYGIDVCNLVGNLEKGYS